MYREISGRQLELVFADVPGVYQDFKQVTTGNKGLAYKLSHITA